MCVRYVTGTGRCWGILGQTGEQQTEPLVYWDHVVRRRPAATCRTNRELNGVKYIERYNMNVLYFVLNDNVRVRGVSFTCTGECDSLIVIVIQYKTYCERVIDAVVTSQRRRECRAVFPPPGGGGPFTLPAACCGLHHFREETHALERDSSSVLIVY